MREMVRRRFAHTDPDWPEPDLVIIDGGKGQLNATKSIIHNAKFIIPVIGLAKRLEEIFIPGKKKALRLKPDSPALHLLQRTRDEAHRFAVGYHISRRSKAQIRSRLDEISGIGPKTKKKLLQKFGSIQSVKRASSEELEDLLGPAKSKIIREQL